MQVTDDEMVGWLLEPWVISAGYLHLGAVLFGSAEPGDYNLVMGFTPL